MKRSADREMAVELKRRRFTIEEYQRMGEAAILDEDERVELIEGEIVEMAPIGPPHASVVARLNALFTARLGDRVITWPQNPWCYDVRRRSSSPISRSCGRGRTFTPGATRSLPTPS